MAHHEGAGPLPPSSPNNSKIKVVHVIAGLETGGAEAMLCKLLAATDRSRFDPAVISLTGAGPLAREIDELGVPVHALEARKSISGVALIPRLALLMRRLRPRIVQGWMYHANIAASLSTLPWSKPIVFWGIHHTLDKLAKEKRTTRLAVRAGVSLSRRVARIIYCSQASAAQHERLGYSPEKTAVIPNGFDCHRYRPDAAARARIRCELGISNEAFAVGLIARWHPVKGHRNFLLAARDLASRARDVRYVLAGSGVDWDNEELTHIVRELGLREHVRLLGPRHDIPAVMAALDVVSLSSQGEAFPNVLGEAMSCEVPCVATDVGDTRLLIGSTGIVVPPEDLQALSQAWAHLMDLGADGRRRLGAAARERIVSNYSVEAISAAYHNLYTAALRACQHSSLVTV